MVTFLDIDELFIYIKTCFYDSYYHFYYQQCNCLLLVACHMIRKRIGFTLLVFFFP